jgi:hypothetical protein
VPDALTIISDRLIIPVYAFLKYGCVFDWEHMESLLAKDSNLKDRIEVIGNLLLRQWDDEVNWVVKLDGSHTF